MNSTFVIPSDFDDLREESTHEHLNQIGFVRAPTPEAQWVILVNDAWYASRIPMNEVVRDYLATMLHRFSTVPEIFDTLAAFDFIQYLLKGKQIDGPCMQTVADTSLQFVAFFPERCAHRHVPRSIAYSTHIGETMYGRLAIQHEGKDDWFSTAYQEMARSFGIAVMVLRSICPRFVHWRGTEQAIIDGCRIPVVGDREVSEAARKADVFSALACATPGTPRFMQ